MHDAELESAISMSMLHSPRHCGPVYTAHQINRLAQSRRDAQPQQKVSRIDHSLLISGCDLDLLAGWRDPPRQAS
jgi:hypothetical protein